MWKEIGLWVIQNPIQTMLSIIGLASIIVKATPTPKDDKILGKIKKHFSTFIALNTELEKLKIKIVKKK